MSDDPFAHATLAEDYLVVVLHLQSSPEYSQFLRYLLSVQQTDPCSQNGWSVRLPSGHRALKQPGGSDYGGAQYPYALLIAGATVLLRDYPRGDAGPPDMVVIIPGQPCLHYGGQRLLHWLYRIILDRTGCTPTDTELRRVDLALDVPGLSVAPFVEAARNRQYVKGTKRVSTDDGDGDAVHVGSAKSGARLTIYDKMAQARRSGQDLVEAMRQRRWGGVIPEAATRIEFQLRSSYLRKHGIRTLPDLLAHRAHLLYELTYNWFRFTTRRPHPNNTSRTPILPEWNQVHWALRRLAGEPPDQAPPAVQVRRPEGQLAAQGIGSLLSAAARSSRDIRTVSELVSYVEELIGDRIGDNEAVHREIETRRLR